MYETFQRIGYTQLRLSFGNSHFPLFSFFLEIVLSSPTVFLLFSKGVFEILGMTHHLLNHLEIPTRVMNMFECSNSFDALHTY